MALITSYSTLQDAVGDWLERSGDSDVSSQVTTWIDLAEARLNRELRGLRTTTVDDATLTGASSSRNISISALAFLAPVALFLTTDSTYTRLRPYAPGTMSLTTSNGYPKAWAINGTNIELDAPCDQAHTFVFRYHQALDIATATNWLLTNYPDVYLYESLKQSAIFFKDVPGAQGYGAIAQQIIDEIKTTEAKNFPAQLTVDPALLNRRGGLTLGEFNAGSF